MAVNLVNLFQSLNEKHESIYRGEGRKTFTMFARFTLKTLEKVQPSTRTGANYPCVMKSMWLLVNRFQTDP
jgi:hypothetical protein